MGGTLEAPTESALLEQDLERPEWMDEIPFEDITSAGTYAYSLFLQVRAVQPATVG